MKILDLEQGSQAWLEARIGRVTSSEMDKIIQPVKRKASASQDAYMAKLVAEWLLGVSLDEAVSQFMERGSALEIDAVKRYEWDNDVTAKAVGLVLRDDEKVGSSPDRLVGNDGLAEFKVPSLLTHVGYMLNNELLVDTYWTQVQGEMWICEREWADLVSHNPSLPQVCVRVLRDHEF